MKTFFVRKRKSVSIFNLFYKDLHFETRPKDNFRNRTIKVSARFFHPTRRYDSDFFAFRKKPVEFYGV